MNSNVNVNVTGRIGRPPSLKTTPGGASVLNFSLSASRPVKKDGEYEDETFWLSVAVWGARAEGLAKALGKGDLVTVSGTFWPRPYQKQDGSESVAYEVQAFNVKRELLSGERSKEARERHARDGSQGRSSRDEDDDIPF